MTRPLVSDWFNPQSIDLFFDRVVCLGDLLEFEMKSGEKHYAVYTGHEIVHGIKEPYVVQCWPECCSGDIPGSNVWKILFGSTDDELTLECSHEKYETILPHMQRVRINNELDADWEPYSVDEILERAKSQTSPAADEDAAISPRKFSSCKHFAIWCRYDENYVNSAKEDSENTAAAIKTGATVGVIGAITAGLGYLFYSFTKRSDAKKPDEEKKTSQDTDDGDKPKEAKE